MAEIKPGDVVCIKTTGEHVYVLGFPESPAVASVRRPKLTRDGIEHTDFTCLTTELETVTEHTQREVAEALERLEAQKFLMNAKVKALASSQQDAVEPEEIDEDGGPEFLPN